ncbi:UNVERIFIED_ORG: general secretion pathway protein I [Variovorax paradoxus]|nr:general secretion pathway protein I [Variovorax paradoxus]
MNNAPCPRESGFTLIEVLIALAIVSIALSAIVRASSLTITNLGLLEQQSLAMLSAESRLAELRMAQGPMVPGVVRGACAQGGLRLVCRTEAGAAVDGLRTVTVDVYLAEDGERRLASLRTRVQDGAGK